MCQLLDQLKEDVENMTANRRPLPNSTTRINSKKSQHTTPTHHETNKLAKIKEETTSSESSNSEEKVDLERLSKFRNLKF